jgi:hypothetical protein
MNLKIINNNLIASNVSLLEGKPVAYLTADKAAGSGTLTVNIISGFSVGKYAVLGNIGEPTAEIVQLHAATAPTGTTITLAANTVKDHYTDTPLTLLDYNQVEFSRATTLAGSKSVLATQAITPDSLGTIYVDLTNTTGYGFARFKNSTTSVFSEYSTGVNYTGNPYNSLEEIALEACSLAGTNLNDDYSQESQLLRDANEAQEIISQAQDWAFELIKNDTSLSTTENENTYSLSGLTYAMKYPDSNQGILDVRFGSTPLNFKSVDEMDEAYKGTTFSTLSVTAAVGATSVTLADTYEFNESGMIYLGANKPTYTTNTETTGVLSGISAADITVEVTAGANVWQGITPGTPLEYTVFNGDIILDVPIKTSEAGKKLKFKYLKKLSRLTDFASVVEIPFYQLLSYYIAGKINRRKRNHTEADKYLELFTTQLQANKDRYALPVLEEQTYYTFSDKDESINRDI